MRMTKLMAVGAILVGATCVHAQDWPQWRGPNRDNKVTGFTEPKAWPKELTQKWKVKVGLGDAGPALVGDKVYVFTRQGADEFILCLDAGTGKEVWQNKYPAVAVTGPGAGHPGPRSQPVVADGKVCTLGVGGTLSCLDAASGKLLWRKETGGKPRFFTSASPVIVDGMCIDYVGGPSKGEIVAYDLTTGAEKWKAPGEAPGYGSPVVMTVDGVKQIVALSDSSLVGVGAKDGKSLWKTPYKSRYNSVTPVVDGDMVICSSEGSSTIAFKIEKTESGFAAKEAWKSSVVSGMYNTPVLKDGAIYGLAASGRGATTMYCLNAKTGEKLWTDATKRGECGEILDAGSVLLTLTSDSNLLVLKPSEKAYSEVAKIKVADSPTWAPPVVAGNRIFVKDKENLILWTVE